MVCKFIKGSNFEPLGFSRGGIFHIWVLFTLNAMLFFFFNFVIVVFRSERVILVRFEHLGGDLLVLEACSRRICEEILSVEALTKAALLKVIFRC